MLGLLHCTDLLLQIIAALFQIILRVVAIACRKLLRPCKFLIQGGQLDPSILDIVAKTLYRICTTVNRLRNRFTYKLSKVDEVSSSSHQGIGKIKHPLGELHKCIFSSLR